MLEYALGSLIVGGIGTFIWSLSHDDGDVVKLKRIFRNCGLTLDEVNPLTNQKKTKELILYRSTKLKDEEGDELGREYAFRIPLGMSYEQVEAKFHNIQDGLTNKKKGVKKYIEMDFDGMLRIRVFHNGPPNRIPYDKKYLRDDWMVPIGMGKSGVIYHDFLKIPHIVVGGTTGYGKTELLRLFILAISRQKPQESEFGLIDLKGGLEFIEFESLQNTRFLAGDIYESQEHLLDLQNVLDERMAEFKKKRIKNIRQAPGMKHIFVFVDEAATITNKKGLKPSSQEYKARAMCERILTDISGRGRSIGIHLIFCTQYPKSNYLPAAIKQNCDAKMCFRLQTRTASEVVIEEGGAEKLPYIEGRALYRTDRKEEMQVLLVSESDIQQLLEEMGGKTIEQDHFERATTRKNTVLIGRFGVRDDRTD